VITRVTITDLDLRTRPSSSLPVQMAAGKSTVAQLLVRETRSIRTCRYGVTCSGVMIVSGSCRHVVLDQAADSHYHPCCRLRYRLGANGRRRLYATAGFTAVVQDVILGPELDPNLPIGSGPGPPLRRCLGFRTPHVFDLERDELSYEVPWYIATGRRSDTGHLGGETTRLGSVCGWTISDLTPRTRPFASIVDTAYPMAAVRLSAAVPCPRAPSSSRGQLYGTFGGLRRSSTADSPVQLEVIYLETSDEPCAMMRNSLASTSLPIGTTRIMSAYHGTQMNRACHDRSAFAAASARAPTLSPATSTIRVFNRLLKERIIFLGSEGQRPGRQTGSCAQLLLLA